MDIDFNPKGRLAHEQHVVDLIEGYRHAGLTPTRGDGPRNPNFWAWDRAREDYRSVRLHFHDDESEIALRDAEHFLLRYFLASEGGIGQSIPDAIGSGSLSLSSGFVRGIHDPIYNWLRPNVFEEVFNNTIMGVYTFSPTTQSMMDWEQRGMDYGYNQGGGLKREPDVYDEPFWQGYVF